MTANNTCVSGNDTATCMGPWSPAGQVLGLTLFFLLLVIVVGVIVYKYHSKIRNMLQFGHTRSQEKEDFTEAAQADSHQYTTMSEQSIGQTPIYENLTTQTTGYNKQSGNKNWSPCQPEEDVYLQCDMEDDAIYSNDPACDLSILPDSQEEDVYIMPDS